MLIAENLKKAYQKESVLKGVTFSVYPGEILGICGVNGSGKTTLINLLASVLPLDDGQISLMGIPVSKTRAYRRLIGYVPQNLALATRLTVRQNLLFWAGLAGWQGKEKQQVVDEAARAAKTEAFMDKTIACCSGGMARRANLAAGLIGRPQLVLLDEPTAGIDPDNRDAILDSIWKLQEQGSMVLMVNHYHQELARICDRIITLKDGQIAETGSAII